MNHENAKTKERIYKGNFKQLRPLFPLETTGAGAAPATDAGICLSA
jgi:hypothetical protein